VVVNFGCIIVGVGLFCLGWVCFHCPAVHQLGRVSKLRLHVLGNCALVQHKLGVRDIVMTHWTTTNYDVWAPRRLHGH